MFHSGKFFIFTRNIYLRSSVNLKCECYSTLETTHKFSFWDYDMAGRSRSRLAFFLPLLLLFAACINTPESESDSFCAFYHWQTGFHLDSLEQSRLQQLAVDRIYVKFFDLDWDPAAGEIVPLASVQLDTSGLAGRQIIPTLFITNRSMLQQPREAIPQLAGRIVEKIDRQFAELDQPLREVQLDCDWTARSRDTYFELLEQLEALYRDRKVALSVTIRLHQLRWPDRTGIPPVDRGVLMFYNMGDLTDWEEPNSILNLEKAAAYLPSGLEYPLHLDLALPLFRWAVLFREGEMIKLINEPADTLIQDSQKFRPLDANRFQVLESSYLDGYYLYEGDLLRVESVSPADLRAAYALVKRQYPAATRNLVFYHLDDRVLQRYTTGDLQLDFLSSQNLESLGESN